MTMEELAALAGVSLSAVSKAFSGSNDINENKRQHIFTVAKEAGCYYKYIKKKMYKPVIAIICNEIRGSLTSKFIYLLDKEIKLQGGTTIISCDNFEKDIRNELISYFAEHVGVDGIILFNPLDELAHYNIPIIMIGESDRYYSVDMTWKRAISEAISHFVEYGHKKIAFIGERHTAIKNTFFEDAIKENNLPVNRDYIIHSHMRFEDAGYDAMNTLLSLPDPPTAVLAAYDNIAFGAMKSIREHGLTIPEDISIIGMNDNEESQFMNVPLTTGTAYPEDLCQIVADVIFEKIRNGNFRDNKRIKISTELVKRGSVGKAK
ncbi:MAG: LacI family DNA-binding transcriptional regulator [Clostridia bacterium]|nr:LacI family DNA-binding transcriptional regulator [Clostridia bacterium]